MSAQSLSLIRRMTWSWAAFSPGLTLIAMVALGAWGHLYKWDIPRMLLFYKGHGPGHFRGPMTVDPANTWPSEPSKPNTGSPLPIEPSDSRVLEFPSPNAIEKAGIRTIAVRAEPVERWVVANGVVGYDQTRYAELSTKVPGTVWRVEKMVGQPVRKGDVLVIIESVEVGKAKAEFLSAIANLEIKQKLLEILSPLTSVVSMRQVKEAEAAVREARVRLFNAHQGLVNLGLPIDIAEARRLPENQLAGRVQFLGLPQAMAQTLDQATTTANLLPLVAPFDGIVIGRNVVIGEVVEPAKSQIVVADLSEMWINLDVRIEDAGSMAIGQPVRFKLDGVSAEVQSTVAWISTEADEKTRTVTVRANAKNPLIGPPEGQKRLLHAHVFGTGRISTGRSNAAMVAPIQAIQYDVAGPVVYVRTSDRAFEQHSVTVGIEGQDKLEILRGLKLGDVVATTGSHLLHTEWNRRRSLASARRP